MQSSLNDVPTTTVIKQRHWLLMLIGSSTVVFSLIFTILKFDRKTIAITTAARHKNPSPSVNRYSAGELKKNYRVPSEVFYFWCGPSRHFEFRHYLSVRSVFKFLNPYRVTIFYENEPFNETRAYDTWLQELAQQYPFFSTSAELPAGCCRQENHEHSVELYLSERGGIYVHEEVILAGPLDGSYRSFDSVTVYEDETKTALIRMSNDRWTSNETISFNHSVRLMRGEGYTQFEYSRMKSGTVQIKTAGTTKSTNDANKIILFRAAARLYPEQIWELDSEAGRLLRNVAYDEREFARPVPDYTELAPNIAHVVWSNNDTMSFTFYLCVLSLLEVARLDNVFIHGDGPPTGPYWHLIESHPKLHIVRRKLIDDRYERIYGTRVANRAHVSDVLRVDILYRFGGLYVDTDAIFFRPLTREMRAYDAVVSPDPTQGQRRFPNNYQNGIMLGKPRAEFWRMHIESMKLYNDDDWMWNCCFNMYKIKERHPKVLLDEPRLNTICMFSNCHPYWEPHLKKSSRRQIAEVMKQWRNSTFAIHHTHPALPEYSNPKALLMNNGTTIFGEVGLYVLEQAGKLEFFKKLFNI